jgi:hypothetical protein
MKPASGLALLSERSLNNLHTQGSATVRPGLSCGGLSQRPVAARFPDVAGGSVPTGQDAVSEILMCFFGKGRAVASAKAGNAPCSWINRP